MDLAWILFSFLAIGQIRSEPTNKNGRIVQKTPITNVDVLARSLNSQQWSVDETPCVDTMMKTLAHAKNFTMWAVWMLDSIQLPTGQLYGASSHLGNYDECLSPHRAFDVTEDIPQFKYCMTDVTLTGALVNGRFSRNPNDTAVTYLNKRSMLRKSLTKALWGLCMPKVCETKSVTKIARAILQTSHLGAMDSTTTIEVKYCKTKRNEGYPLGFYISVYSVIIFAVMTVCISYYSWTHNLPRDSFVGELARSFCLERNMKVLTNVRDDEIYSMNLIRIVSSSLLVVVHYVLLILLQFTVNMLDAEEIFYNVSDYSIHLDIATDTFFTLSGLLFTRGMFLDKWKSPLKYIWKRYVRLIVGIIVSTTVMALVLEHIADGPLWDLIPREEINVCKTNWWHTLLLIHNLVDSRNLCNLVSWYVPCDFQLCVLAAIIFCVYRNNKKLGSLLLYLTIAAGITLSGFSNYWMGFRPTSFIGTDTYPRHSHDFYNNYVKTYTHTSPFMIGVVVGYIIYKYKPKDYRKTISQFWSYFVILVALCLMRVCLYGGHYFYFEVTEVTGLSAMYTATNRTVWAASVGAIILICEYGDVPILHKAMAWYPLVPISRLSYNLYLLQHPFQLYHAGSLRSLVHYDDYQIVLATTTIIVFLYVASLFIWLFLEAPIINISNMLTYKTWKKTAEINTKVCNGKQDQIKNKKL